MLCVTRFFCCRAKNIKNTALVNKDVSQKALLSAYQKEIHKLKEQLEQRLALDHSTIIIFLTDPYFSSNIPHSIQHNINVTVFPLASEKPFDFCVSSGKDCDVLLQTISTRNIRIMLKSIIAYTNPWAHHCMFVNYVPLTAL